MVRRYEACKRSWDRPAEKETGGEKSRKSLCFLQSPVSPACPKMGGDIPNCPGFLILSPSSSTLARSVSADQQQTDSTTSFCCCRDSLKARTRHTFSMQTLPKSLPEHFRAWMGMAGARSRMSSSSFWPRVVVLHVTLPAPGAPGMPGLMCLRGSTALENFHGAFP